MRGDGLVYKRGNVWWIKFHRDGQPVYMSCKGMTETQAKTKLKHELRKSDEDFVEPRAKRTTIQDLFDNLQAHYEAQGLDKYKSMTAAQWKHHLSAPFANVKAHMFGTEHQLKYRTQRTKDGAANATINRELQVLRKAFKLGAEHEPPLVKRIPKFKITREDNARQGFVTTTQLTAIKNEALKYGMEHGRDLRFNFEYRVLVEMAHILGWRVSEMIGLDVVNIQLADNVIRLETSKNKEKREAQLSQSLRVLLEPMVVGRKPEEKLFSFVTIQKAWKKITAAAGCPGVLFHDLRRTSARSKRQAGVDSSVIMKMSGWKTDAMFRRYGIVAAEDQVDALAKQEAYEKQLQLAEAARIAEKKQEEPVVDPLQLRYTGSEN